MQATYLKNIEEHIYVTDKLIKALIAYLECKNYGIHGLFIKKANLLVASLCEEKEYLERTKNYLMGDKPKPTRFNKEPLIFLTLKSVSPEVVNLLAKDLAYCLGLYADFTQSQYTTELKRFLEQLENV